MNLIITIIVTAIILLSFDSPVFAGQKLYNFDVIFRDSPDRLEGSKVTRGKAPIIRTYKVNSPTVTAPISAPAQVHSSWQKQRPSIISELIGGVWSHDPGEINEESNSWDFNGEIIFKNIRLFNVRNRFLKFLAEPRPHIGGSINSEVKTNTVYAGFSWAHHFRNGLFFNFSLGGTYHTGNLEQATRQCATGEGCALPGNRAYVDTREPTLGSAILFREGLDLGYRIGPHGASIFASHISNAGLDNDNDGMNFVGMRYSFAFDNNFRN